MGSLAADVTPLKFVFSRIVSLVKTTPLDGVTCVVVAGNTTPSAEEKLYSICDFAGRIYVSTFYIIKLTTTQ